MLGRMTDDPFPPEAPRVWARTAAPCARPDGEARYVVTTAGLAGLVAWLRGRRPVLALAPWPPVGGMAVARLSVPLSGPDTGGVVTARLVAGGHDPVPLAWTRQGPGAASLEGAWRLVPPPGMIPAALEASVHRPGIGTVVYVFPLLLGDPDGRPLGAVSWTTPPPRA